MKITKKQSKEFVDGVCKGLIDIGAKEVKGLISTKKSFELETIVGKLNISVDTDNVYCYSVFSRFFDVEKAKQKVNCNPYSGKYNFHRGNDNCSTKQITEFALMHFEGLEN